MGIFAIFVAAFFSALNLPALKLGLELFSPVFLMFIRFSLAVLLFLPFYFRKKTRPQNLRQALRVMAACSFFSLALLLIIYGLQKTTVSSTNAILAFVPVMTAAGAIHLLKEKISKIQIVGIFLGFIGVFAAIVSPSLATDLVNTGTALGNTLVFLSTISTTVYVLLTKKLSKTYGSSVITFYSLLTSALAFGVLTFLDIIFAGEGLKFSFSTEAVAVVLYLAIFGSVVNFLAFQYGLKKTTAFFTGLVPYIQLPMSVYLGVLIFDDQLSNTFYTSTALIVIGAILAARTWSRAKFDYALKD